MPDIVLHEAQCSCWRFYVMESGDPEWVNMCNCYDCQRRSGSAFQIAGFMKNNNWLRILATGRPLTVSPRTAERWIWSFAPSVACQSRFE